MKVCPICDRDETQTEFGICRAHADGRNLYCKSCIRVKVKTQRAQLKAINKKRQTYLETIDRKLDVISIPAPSTPIEKVKRAIERGSHTRLEIKQVTRLTMDEVCDALAELRFDQMAITTQVVNGERVFKVA